MYDHPAVRHANDALWRAIAARLRAAGSDRVPDTLDRGRPLDAIWSDPDLLLAQTCGYPLTTRWAGRLRLVATPRYVAAGCTGAFHRSRIVVRRDDPAGTLADLRGRRAALNDRGSNSGMNLFRAAVAPLAAGAPFFAAVVASGGHAESARLVASGGADVAAIDAVTFALLERHEPAVADKLRTLGWTAASPGLPLVTARATTRPALAALRAAFQDVAGDPALADVRTALLIDGFEVLHPARYRIVAGFEHAAIRAGYPVLA